MKYLSIILLSTTAFAAVQVSKVPDFIHTCKRNDTEVSECVRNSIMSLRKELTEGIPELGLDTIDPLKIDELALNFGLGISAVGRNLLVRGLKNYQVKNVVVDYDTDTYNFDVIVPGGSIEGNYEIEAMIGFFPFKGKGPLKISAKHAFAPVSIRGKKVARHGKTRYYFPSADAKLVLTDFEIMLGNLFEGAPRVGEIINRMLNLAKDRVLERILPTVEARMIKELLYYANKVVTPFTADELFPEF